MKNVKLRDAQSTDNTATCPQALSDVIDLADQKDIIDQQQISQLTQLVLNIRPEQVDAQMQAKLFGILHKVKAQYA